MERCDKGLHEEFVERVVRLRRLSPNQEALENYLLIKEEVDGRREATGTFPLFGQRLAKLRSLIERNGAFYELLGSYEDLLKLGLENNRLSEGHAPRWALNRLSVSVRIFESAYEAVRGELPMPLPSEAEQGVHFVSLDGIPSRAGAFPFTNSWGENWGEKGRGLLSRVYLESYIVEACLYRTSGIGPTRSTLPLLRRRNAANPKAYAEAWMLGAAPIKRDLRHGGEKHTARIRETLSASDEPVEMIELHDPSGRPIAWAHLHHIVGSNSRISVCKEFFVWPHVRKRGYGRLLEKLAADRAEEWGSERIKIVFHEADDHPKGATAAKALATGAGYEWEWVSQQRPNVSAVASRDL